MKSPFNYIVTNKVIYIVTLYSNYIVSLNKVTIRVTILFTFDSLIVSVIQNG